MKRVLSIALAAACCWTASTRLHAQAPASDSAGSSQSKPAETQKPGAPQESNPFPEDTSSVPVLPTASSPAAPPPAFNAADSGSIHLPRADSDPVRSPDDPASDADASQDDASSSSLQGIDQMIEPPPDSGKRDKKQKDEAMPHAGPKEDINVGSYYLQTGNWKGALSRFESALVLAPDNPDVYWGLGEAQRHLGNYSAAKAYYLQLIDYDPDSKHGKEARKILKQPEMVSAAAAAPGAPAAQQQQ
jgi:hypothetical protein